MKYRWRDHYELEPELRVRLAMESRNTKTGPIPNSITSPGSCPKSCPWFNRGCYAEQYVLSAIWKGARNGMSWKEFCSKVREIPEGSLWRHNAAGDLPGFGEDIDHGMLDRLVRANQGKRGFTYTHKPMSLRDNLQAVVHANREGFAVNLSADGLHAVDGAVDLGLPVTVLLPADAPEALTTARKRPVVLCPAQLGKKTCQTCGWCAMIDRKFVVGFRAHGNFANRVSLRLVQRNLFD